MPLTPSIRAFLDELQALLDDKPLPEVTTADAVALVRLATTPAIELEVTDTTVRLRYGGEWQLLRDRAFALKVVDALRRVA